MKQHSDVIPQRTGDYNDWEKHVIRTLYPTGGTTAVRARFNEVGYDRKRQAIREKARQLGVQFGHLPGYVRLNEMFFDEVRGKPWIMEKARRDGVLVECGASNKPQAKLYLVPEWWAMNAFTEMTDSHALWDSPEWIGSTEAARMFGVSPETLRRAASGKDRVARLKRSIGGVPTHRDLQGRWLFRRYETERAVRFYRELRRRAKYAPPIREAA